MTLFFVQCAACKTEAPATDNAGTPDIPADWRALHAQSNPTYELYVCAQLRCMNMTSFALNQSYPYDQIMERRVEACLLPSNLE